MSRARFGFKPPKNIASSSSFYSSISNQVASNYKPISSQVQNSHARVNDTEFNMQIFEDTKSF